MVHSGVYTLLSIIEILFCCTDESNVVSGLDPSKSKAAPPEVCSAMHFGQPQTTLHEAAGKVKYLQSFLKENFLQSYKRSLDYLIYEESYSSFSQVFYPLLTLFHVIKKIASTFSQFLCNKIVNSKFIWFKYSSRFRIGNS